MRILKKHNEAAALAKPFYLNALDINPSSKLNNGKYLIMKDALHSIHNQSCFFFISVQNENHPNGHHLEAELKIREVTTIYGDRVSHRKVGYSVFFRCSFSADAKEIFSNTYCESVTVYNKGKDRFVIAL